MSTGLFAATPNQVRDLFPRFPDDLGDHLRLSAPLLVGLLADAPFCVVGLIPTTIVSSSALVWGWNSPLVPAHRLTYARWSRRFLTRALTAYPEIHVLCVPWKRRWIESLGATIVGTHDHLLHFQLKASAP